MQKHKGDIPSTPCQRTVGQVSGNNNSGTLRQRQELLPQAD